jgi:hypothetical protein
MDHRTRVSTKDQASVLRYKLTPGSTAQYEVRLDLHMEIRPAPDADPETLEAQITTDIDFEVVMAPDDEPAVVRVHERNTSMWVTSESTLAEADMTGHEVAPPDDTNAAPFILKAMLPLYAENAVTPGEEWDVRSEHGTVGHQDPGDTHCLYVSVEHDPAGWVEPVIRHRYAYQWSQEGERGATAYAADTRVSTRDGWPREVRGEVEIDRHFGRTTVRVTATRRR